MELEKSNWNFKMCFDQISLDKIIAIKYLLAIRLVIKELIKSEQLETIAPKIVKSYLSGNKSL